jgi:hypothetical protein
MSCVHPSKNCLRIRTILTAVTAASLATMPTIVQTLPAWAADEAKDGSAMDESIWMEGTQQTKGNSQDAKAAGAATGSQKDEKPVTPNFAPEPGALQAGQEAAGEQPANATDQPASAEAQPNKFANSETRAPMCSLENFKTSALVQKGGWPGVGPFKVDGDPTSYVDENHNQLKIEVEGDKVTKAELHLTGKKAGTTSSALLDMQMTVDFLLESVGIKPKRIADLNSQLEKRKDVLERQPTLVNLTTGRYSVSIDKQASGQENGLDYIIAVNSLEASRQAIKEHSVHEDHQAPPEKSTIKPTKEPEKVALTQPKDLKEDFVNLIKAWQKVKKSAVRTRQTEELADVLAGNALAKQTDAVKWLTEHHRYYEMTPKGVTVDKYAEISAGKKYLVAAQVREAYKYVDADSRNVVKESDDTYRVNYTIEKIGWHWAITDSSLVSTTTMQIAKPQTPKTH